MPPDDLPIPSTADDTSGVKPPAPNKNPPMPEKGAESEVRGGHEAVPDRPLEQVRREERR
jgi:hypothetical protein